MKKIALFVAAIAISVAAGGVYASNTAPSPLTKQSLEMAQNMYFSMFLDDSKYIETNQLLVKLHKASAKECAATLEDTTSNRVQFRFGCHDRNYDQDGSGPEELVSGRGVFEISGGAAREFFGCSARKDLAVGYFQQSCFAKNAEGEDIVVTFKML